jgi:hypothetical protein
MQDGKGIGVLVAILVLCPQLAQSCLAPLGDGGLRDQAA